MFPGPSSWAGLGSGREEVTVWPLALGSCQLTVLALGRGSINLNRASCGGGNGFPEWTNIKFVGLTKLTISWSSTVTEVFMEDNKDFLSARPGQDGSSRVGGDGYSGGGCLSGDGGTNGSNGTSTDSRCRAGMGSGLLLTDIPVNSFTLT